MRQWGTALFLFFSIFIKPLVPIPGALSPNNWHHITVTNPRTPGTTIRCQTSCRNPLGGRCWVTFSTWPKYLFGVLYAEIPHREFTEEVLEGWDADQQPARKYFKERVASEQQWASRKTWKTCHISCSVGVAPTFGLKQGGNTSFGTCKWFSATRADAYTAKQRRLLRWSCSGLECDCVLEIAAGSDSFVTSYVVLQRKFGVLALWSERSTHLASLCTIESDLRADSVARLIRRNTQNY